jgi:hypothetical protein
VPLHYTGATRPKAMGPIPGERKFARFAAYAKINANGQWVDRSECINLNELFERMTREEMEAYAREGSLPAWFQQAVGATNLNSHRGPSDD